MNPWADLLVSGLAMAAGLVAGWWSGRYGFMLDHWVCVLGVSAGGVEVGDPNVGRETWTREESERRWRKVGVTVGRRPGWREGVAGF